MKLAVHNADVVSIIILVDLSFYTQVVAKEIGSFLNGKGGILCFGCRTNGTDTHRI